jgi:predicted nucleic acid-binding protein
VNALFDSNILIDYLNGLPAARKELDLYERRAISVVTWMEVMAGAEAEFEAVTRQFLGRFEVLPVDPAVAERAVKFRATKSLKLPDAIVLASAIEAGLILVTRDSKAFSRDTPAVRIPYSVKG